MTVWPLADWTAGKRADMLVASRVEMKVEMWVDL